MPHTDFALLDITSFDTSLTKSSPTYSFNKDWVALSATVPCPAHGSVPAFAAKLDLEVVVSGTAQVTFGIAAAGHLLPDVDITDFGIVVGMS